MFLRKNLLLILLSVLSLVLLVVLLFCIKEDSSQFVFGPGSNEKYFLEQLKKYPDSPSAIASLAFEYHLQGRYDEAIHLYQKLIEKYPDEWSPYEKLALVYQSKSKNTANQDKKTELLDSAFAFAEIAVIKSNYNPLAAIGLGKFFESEKKYFKADTIYTEAFKHFDEVSITLKGDGGTLGLTDDQLRQLKEELQVVKHTLNNKMQTENK
jgi:tetratricopeptide (TPR) repeat protein